MSIQQKLSCMASTDSEWTGDMAIEDSCIQQTGVTDGSLNAKTSIFHSKIR